MVAEPEARTALSDARTTVTVIEERPARRSLAEPVMVTAWFNVLAGTAFTLTLGAVLSIFTPLTVALAELPARSVTVKVWDWPLPSVLKVKLPLSVPAGRPDRASLAL